ncbi:hypothetical protein TNCV_3026081 [Trichonephila clavipes]|nr:hypothetical protein TNCV_3026081 [Trichonephila clavipes]
MAAPLTICTKEERGTVIRFLSAEGVKPAEIIRRVTAVYREARPTNGQSASNREELFYVTTEDRAVHRHQVQRTMYKSLRGMDLTKPLQKSRDATFSVDWLKLKS